MEVSLTAMPTEKVNEWDNRLTSLEKLFRDVLNKPQDIDPLLTIAQAQKIIPMEAQWFRNRKEEIGFTQFGRDILFLKSKVDEFKMKNFYQKIEKRK